MRPYPAGTNIVIAELRRSTRMLAMTESLPLGGSAGYISATYTPLPVCDGPTAVRRMPGPHCLGRILEFGIRVAWNPDEETRSWSQSETTRLISLVIAADVFWPPSLKNHGFLCLGSE